MLTVIAITATVAAGLAFSIGASPYKGLWSHETRFFALVTYCILTATALSALFAGGRLMAATQPGGHSLLVQIAGIVIAYLLVTIGGIGGFGASLQSMIWRDQIGVGNTFAPTKS